MPENTFLQAFEGKNKRVPVWFMRQAGRYLPEYQAIRRTHDLNDMFRNPTIAAEVTCQPIDIIGVDAAILFADILTLPALMGFDITFDPKRGPIIQTFTSLDKIHDIDDIEHVGKTIHLVNKQLDPSIPLIGFAGSPFTVLTYLIEGGSTTSFHKTYQFIEEQEDTYHALMESLTRNTIKYLEMQKQAGIKAFQLFDSWVGVLSEEDYDRLVLPYVQQIFNRIDLPSIYFPKSSAHLLNSISDINVDFISVCHHINIKDNHTLLQSKKGIQGNLFNGLLYADDEKLVEETLRVLNNARCYDKYIFNLSHGVFLDVNPDKLKLIVKTVHDFSWEN
jgi:uroporphyrinogen decarboxylase